MKRLLTAIAVAGGISFFLAIIFSDLSAPDRTSGIDDLSTFDLYFWYLPHLSFTKWSVLNGSLPLWTPYQGVGQPFLAMSGCLFFYPFTWSIFLMDVPHAMLLIQFLNIAVGMAGMAIYLRYLKLDWPAVILASVIFGYSVLWETFSPGCGSTYCWLPAAIWLTHRLVDKPSFGACAALAASLTLCFLGGFPQYFYYISTIVGVYFIFLTFPVWFRGDRRGALFRTGLIGLAFALTACLISFQLLPMLELSTFSVRDVTEKLPGSQMHPFGNIRVIQVLKSQLTGILYFQLFLIPFSLGTKRLRPVAITLLAVMGFMIIFVVSMQMPALAIFRKIPFAGTFRLQERMLHFVPFAVSALAGIGLSSFWERKPTGLRGSRNFALDWFWIFVFMCMLALSYPMLRSAVQLLFDTSVFLAPLLLCTLIALAYALYRSKYPPNVKRALGGALVLLILLALTIHWRDIHPASHIAIFLTIAVGVLLSSSDSLRFVPRAKSLIVWVVALLIVWYTVSETRAAVARRVIPAFTNVSLEKHGLFSPLKDALTWAKENAGHNRVYFARGKIPLTCYNVGNMFQLGSIDSYSSLSLRRWNNFVRLTVGPERFDELLSKAPFYGMNLNPRIAKSFLRQRQLTGLISLRYILTYGATKEETLHKSLEPLYINPFALPRTYLVSGYKITQNEEESLEAIKEGVAGLAYTVILENGEPSFVSANMRDNPGRAWIKRYGVNEVELGVEADRDCIVVLTDSYYPGWHAFVDGVEKPIWRANSLFRAVEAPSGAHTITFRYRPASFIWGSVISLCSAALIVLGLFLERRRRKILNSHAPPQAGQV